MNDQIRFYEQKLQYQTDAYDLFAALNAGAGTIVIDARSPQAYETEHIPSALNIPHRTMADATTAHLDRAAPMSSTATASAAMHRPGAH